MQVDLSALTGELREMVEKTLNAEL